MRQPSTRLPKLGVKVMVTELDIDVLPITKEGQLIGKMMNDSQWQLEEFKAFLDPYRKGLPADVEAQLTKRLHRNLRDLLQETRQN